MHNFLGYIMKCFKCFLTFTEANHLILHLKHNHLLRSTDTYLCITDSCHRYYSSVNSFRKHLSIYHKNKNICIKFDEYKANATNVINDNKDERINPQYEREIENAKIESTYQDLSSMCNDNILQNMNVNECIKSHLVSFILTMYNDPLLSRKSIQMILTNVFSLFNNYLLPNLKYKLDTQLSLSTEHTNILDQINEIFATFTNPFDEFSTEYKRLKFLENYRFYFPPESYIIGQAKIAKNVKNRIVDNVIDVTGRHILLRNTLKSILEIPGMLNEIKKYI